VSKEGGGWDDRSFRRTDIEGGEEGNRLRFGKKATM